MPRFSAQGTLRLLPEPFLGTRLFNRSPGEGRRDFTPPEGAAAANGRIKYQRERKRLSPRDCDGDGARGWHCRGERAGQTLQSREGRAEEPPKALYVPEAGTAASSASGCSEQLQARQVMVCPTQAPHPVSHSQADFHSPVLGTESRD